MSNQVEIARTVKDLRRHVKAFRERRESVALVPTMGALHDGHVSLVKRARETCDRVVVSIFVNPTQFAPTEDLARYPRDEAGDLAKLGAAATDLVWAPSLAAMYPDGFSTGVAPGSAAHGMEGAIRPHHFGGVATVCCKLFSQVLPDIAIFGEKDYQQMIVLQQMVRDLDLPLQIIGAPTLRAADGLALSSRNAYLSDPERKIAPALFKALTALAAAIADGAAIKSAIANAEQNILDAGFASVDYIEVRDADNLAEISATKPAKTGLAKLRVLAAARLGKTRLIDNVAVG